jgi:DNA-binding transcriptional MerR regulator
VDPTQYTLDHLANLAGVPRRTVRYYIQLGLVDRPIGETRAAYYTWQHLRQLLEIRRLTEQGFSLERVRELMEQGAPRAAAPAMTLLATAARAPRPGSLTVQSHVHLADGVELVIDPDRARLSPEALRQFARDAIAAYERALADQTKKEN